MGEAFPINVRARAIIIHQQYLLVVKNLGVSDCYFLPGGGVAFNENASQALRRRLREESDYVLPADISFTGVIENQFQAVDGPAHSLLLHFYYHSDEPPPFVISRERHLQFDWVELPALADITLLPKPTRAAIDLAGHEQNFYFSYRD